MSFLLVQSVVLDVVRFVLSKTSKYIHSLSQIIRPAYMPLYNKSNNIAWKPLKYFRDSLQLVIILPIDGSANNSLSVVSCRHIYEIVHSEELLEITTLYFLQYWINDVMIGLWVRANTYVYMKSAAFWDVAEPPAFTLISCLLYFCTLKMEAGCSCEASLDFQRTAWYYIPEDSILHNHRFENFKFYITLYLHIYLLVSWKIRKWLFVMISWFHTWGLTWTIDAGE
jgi:hypothetical protein